MSNTGSNLQNATAGNRVLRGYELSALEKARPANDPTGKKSLRIAIVSENFLPKVSFTFHKRSVVSSRDSLYEN